ncbi:MAG: hypothetical protein II730_05740 [Bacteroidales bacterium]|nr:hypothetical protein [Bacteroidales bacterium]
MPQDYIIKEIGKFGEMLAKIAMRLGILGNEVAPPDNLPDALKTELLEEAGLDTDYLLSLENPLEYLISEKGLTNQDLETLTIMLLKAGPMTEALESFGNDVMAYLDHEGVFSFALHGMLI